MQNPKQDQIEAATAAFLAAGGTITQATAKDNAATNERPRTRRERLAWRKQKDWAEKNAHRARKSRGH